MALDRRRLRLDRRHEGAERRADVVGAEEGQTHEVVNRRRLRVDLERLFAHETRHLELALLEVVSGQVLVGVDVFGVSDERLT